MLSFNTACRASLVHWLTKPVIMDMEFSPHHIKGFTNYIKMNNTTISVETKLRKKKMKLKSSRNLSIGNGLLPLMHPDVTEILHVGMIIFFHSKKCTLSTQIKKWSNKSLSLAEFYLSIGFVLAGNLCHLLFLQHSRIWSGYHILDVIMSDFVLVEELAVKIFESSHN